MELAVTLDPGPGIPVQRAVAVGASARLLHASELFEDHYYPIVWGILRGCGDLMRHKAKRRKHFYHLDHGYFRPGHYDGFYRLTPDALAQPWIDERWPDRWSSLGIEIEPWRIGGRKVVVCPPTDAMAAFYGAESWLNDTLAVLARSTDREIVVRRKGDPTPLSDVLADAHAVVAFNSNAAVEAVIAGVPVFVAPINAAAPVGRTDFARIETPIYPDREPWCWSLAYGQWTLDELKDGVPWKHLPRFESLSASTPARSTLTRWLNTRSASTRASR